MRSAIWMPVNVFRISITITSRLRRVVADSVDFFDGPLRPVLARIELLGSCRYALPFTHQIALTEDALDEVPSCTIRLEALSMPKFMRSYFAQPEVHDPSASSTRQVKALSDVLHKHSRSAVGRRRAHHAPGSLPTKLLIRKVQQADASGIR